MSEPTGWGKRSRYRPDPGVEIDKDNQLFDVVEWRRGRDTAEESRTQERNGQTHVRVYDPQLEKRLGDIAELLEKTVRHLALLTGEEDI